MDKRLVIIAVICAVALLFGCIGTQPTPGNRTNTTNITTNITANVTNQTNETPVIAPKSCEELTTGKESCIIQRAFDNNRYSDCMLLNGSYYSECVYTLAEISYGNCLYFSSSDAADDCLLNVTVRYGSVVCKNVINQTKQDECKVLSISPGCRQLTEEDERLSCDAVAKNNDSVCDSASGGDIRDDCYLEFSMKKSDSCNKISNEGVKVACDGLVQHNTSSCAGITSASLIKDNCYKTYAEESGNCSMCNSVRDIIYKDNCFVDCATENNDYASCAGSSNEQKADNCYWQYSVKIGNVSVCDMVKTKSLRRLCIEQVAIRNMKPSECERIPNIYGYSQADVGVCYLDVIATTNVTIDNCRLMSDGYSEDTCINNAIKRDNLFRGNCTYIQDATLKSACYAS